MFIMDTKFYNQKLNELINSIRANSDTSIRANSDTSITGEEQAIILDALTTVDNLLINKRRLIESTINKMKKK